MTEIERGEVEIAEPGRQLESVSRGNWARFLEKMGKGYPMPTLDGDSPYTGFNIYSALSAMGAILKKGQEAGWEYPDLLFGHEATLGALATAGLPNAGASIEALLTGATGRAKEIMDKIIPAGSSRLVRSVARVGVGIKDVDNCLQVMRIIGLESKIEKRFRELAGLQQGILSDPKRRETLLMMLNSGNSLTLRSGDCAPMPQEVVRLLNRISFFSLTDLKAITQVFDAIEKYAGWQLKKVAIKKGADLLSDKLDLGLTCIGEGSSKVVRSLLGNLGGLVGAAGGGIRFSFPDGVVDEWVKARERHEQRTGLGKKLKT